MIEEILLTDEWFFLVFLKLNLPTVTTEEVSGPLSLVTIASWAPVALELFITLRCHSDTVSMIPYPTHVA